ncbi:hypothetical protein FQ087_18325 [Sporosarcina sp. ANT_H38]|uniref:hypothetical protein n=1 Tax=Sporosarcina sp. ANT_H38 TaxID=2597358 RepID=UPI0011F23909|nr:hypothetical protein [Sporosarcina sp. ANT_H38]KAA0944083.1 hypothetical protein FQ087_18325 [Sporosarcina sp. ANT_H38]
MPRKYQRKPQCVEALKTYFGQPMTDIRDFLLGSSVFVSTMEHGGIFEERLKGVLDVTPGDYILRSYDGQVTACNAIEFEKIYQEEVSPQELQFVITKYSFLVKDAEMMLRDERIRPILLASFFEQNKLSPAVTVNQSFNMKDETAIGRIANGITERMHEELLKVTTGAY